MKRTNIRHGQKRPHTSMVEVGCLGVLFAVALTAFTLMVSPNIGGGV